MPWTDLDPKTFATVRRNDRHEIRIDVARKPGRCLIQLREWRMNELDVWCPGPAHVVIRRSSLANLIQALQSVADSLGVDA